MNYSSVQEIFDVGITHATVIRNNVKNDSAVDSISPPDWLTFNGKEVTALSVHGDSYITIGPSAGKISVNERNAACYYVFFEEGTLYHIQRFIKIRWSGFTANNTTSAAAKLTYDIVIFESGEILIYFVDMPTANVNGINQLESNQTYPFIIPTNGKYVSFRPTEIVGEYTEPLYEMINIEKEYVEKYLLLVDNVICTIEDETLVQIMDETLTSQLFVDRGIDEPPSKEILLQLQKFSILHWCSEEDFDEHATLTVSMNAIPHVQEVVTNKIDMSHYSIIGLKSVTHEIEGDVLILFSIDNKETWIGWDGLQWAEKSDTFLGMTKEVLESLTVESLMQLYDVSKEIFIKVIISDETQKITLITLNYENEKEVI